MPENGPYGNRPHKGECHRCGGDMTDGQKRRQEFAEQMERRSDEIIDSTFAHLRSVIANCETATVQAIRHQLVGLLPEAREMPPDQAEELRARGMGQLVDLHEERVKAAWAEFGYPSEDDGNA